LEHAVIGSWNLATDVLVQEQNLNDNDRASFSNNDNSNDFDIIGIQHEIMHPLYNDENIRHDVLILILETSSSKKVVKINHDPELPSIVDTSVFPNATRSASNGGGSGGSGGDGFGSWLLNPSSAPPPQQQQQQQQQDPTDEATTRTEKPLYMENLTAIGFGQGSEDFLLYYTTLHYVPNPICEQATDGKEFYEGSIYKDMLCTFAVGSDTCYGDSGGPLILTRQRMVPTNNSSSSAKAATLDGWVPEVEEIQVGVTSWYVEKKGESVVPAFWLPNPKDRLYMGSMRPSWCSSPSVRPFCVPFIGIFLALFQFDHFCSFPIIIGDIRVPIQTFRVFRHGSVKVMTLFVNKSVPLLPIRHPTTFAVPNLLLPTHRRPHQRRSRLPPPCLQPPLS
jgi:Trypsin